MREEIREYCGIEYRLVLMGMEEQAIPTTWGNKNPDQWWCLEWTEKSRKLAQSISYEVLFFTANNPDDRMQDKYHYCEVQAIRDIEWVMDKYFVFRTKWLVNEISCYVYATIFTTPQRIKFKLNKIFRKNK